MIVIYRHVQNSVYNFWPFVDIDTPTNFEVSSLSMLFLPKYVYCSKITNKVPLKQMLLGQRFCSLFQRNFKMLMEHVCS